MIDKYIERMLKSSKELIKSGDFFPAGDNLIKLARYGTVIDNPLLVFLSSELSDVFRNCFNGSKEFQKEIDLTLINDIIERVYELMDIMETNNEVIEDKLKIKIFNMLMYVISNAERIQLSIRDLETKRQFKRRRIVSRGI